MKDYKEAIESIMKDTTSKVMDHAIKAYRQGYEDGQKEKLANVMIHDHEVAEKTAYERGLNDAWDAARKIAVDITDGGYSLDELREIFNETLTRIIFKRNTASEAIAKIKEYEDEQKQDAEIKVGDEIVYIDGIKGIVVGISNIAGQISVLNNEYDVPQLIVKNRAKKTGRTFSQIAEVLAELRGAENDE